MAADPRHELRELIERLSQEDAAALLAAAQRLDAARRGRALPTLYTAPPIADIDELRGPVFPPERRRRVRRYHPALARGRQRAACLTPPGAPRRCLLDADGSSQSAFPSMS